MVVSTIGSIEEFKRLQAEGQKAILFFWAQWQDQSKIGSQIHDIFTALSEKYTDIKFLTVEAEEVHGVSEILGVTVVPTFYSIVGSTNIEKLEGIFPAELSALAKKLRELEIPKVRDSVSKEEIKDQKTELNKKLEKLIQLAPVMLFMKGSPDQPRCGFSRQIVEILKGNGIQFASFDILTDEEVRAGLKVYSDWPSYPQLYVNGSLIGGLDIVKELVAAGGSLKEQLGVKDIQLPPPPSSLEERLRSLINKAAVMLFMKGSPDSPKCGFSRAIVDILRVNNIPFSSFDILTDEEVRAGLKTYSDWPTYPQLYVNGALIGGLDIVKELAAGEEPLAKQFNIL